LRSKLTAIAIAALLATEAAGVAPEDPHAALAARGHLPIGWAGAELGIARTTGYLERVFRAARVHSSKLSRLPSVRSQDVAACNADVSDRLDSPRFTINGAADRAGSLFCASQPLTSPVSIADRPYFLRAIGTRRYAVGDFQVGKVSGRGALGTGYPVRGADGAINGVVFSDLSVDWLGRHLCARRPRGALDVLVTDDHGTVLARCGRTRTPPGRNLGRNPLVRAMLAGDRGTGAFRIAGRRVTSAYAAIKPTGGAVHVALSVRR
jgi:hypothetical protein